MSEAEGVLRFARDEAERVSAALRRPIRLDGPQATRDALNRGLKQARVAHFACHAYFQPEHPLSACIGLPSGERWDALEWLDGPAEGLPLAALSACRSAEVAPLVGEEVFGLVTAVLSAGVRAVLAGAWPVPDHPATVELMSVFYRKRLTADLATALALAQRAVLSRPDCSPLAWAVFGLYGDATALPAPPWWLRWWRTRQERRHAERFPPLPIS
jgi:CHAT domain-containing protein